MLKDKTLTLGQAIDAENAKLNAATQNKGESLANTEEGPPQFVPVGNLDNLNKTLEQLTAE